MFLSLPHTPRAEIRGISHAGAGDQTQVLTLVSQDLPMERSPALIFLFLFAHLLTGLKKGHTATQFCRYSLRPSASDRRPVSSPTRGRPSKAIPSREAVSGPWNGSPPPPLPCSALQYLSLAGERCPLLAQVDSAAKARLQHLVKAQSKFRKTN